MRMTFNLSHPIHGDSLQCPACMGTNLSHRQIDVFEREEDCATGLHACITQSTVTVDNSQENNPSPRRNGLRIALQCENCQATPELIVSQHKGRTFINLV